MTGQWMAMAMAMARAGIRTARRLAMVALAGAWLLGAAGARAQDPNAGAGAPREPGWFDVPEVLVTASRSEMEAFAAPYSTEVIPFDGFARRGLYRTTTDALEHVPGVMVQKTAHAQGSPYIRGFTGFRTLMLVDGIRLNNAIFRDGPNQYWNLIDPYTIDRLEVVKGPSSVLYGSDAIGGTVNAILRRPDGYGEGLQSYRQLFGRYATAERGLSGRGEAVVTYDSWLGALAGGTVRHFGDLYGGTFVGTQEFTGYEVCSGDARIEIHPTPDSTLTFAHYQLYKDDAWRTHKTIHGISWQGTTVGDELERVLDEGRSLTYLRYAQRNTGAFVDAWQVTASLQQITERRWRIRDDGRMDRQGADVWTSGLAAQFETPSEIGRWTYGAEWYHDDVQSFKDRWNADGSFDRSDIQGPVGDNATYDLVGVFVQDAVPLHDRVELILGGRYTFARAEADKVQDPDSGSVIGIADEWHSLVGSGRLSWFVDEAEHWNVFGGVSQGFRAPNLSDLTRLDTARSGEIETPTPELDPERFITYEAGVKTKYDNVVAQAAYFFTDIDDMIVRTPTGEVVSGDNEVTKSNVGDGYVHGVELGARWRFHPQLTAFGNVTWMYGEVDTFPTSARIERSEPISRLMPPTGQAGMRWDHPSGDYWAQAAMNVAGKADELSTRDRADTQRIPPGGTPGYVTVDLRGGWRVKEGLEVWAGVENLLNDDHRIHGSGVNEPGINLKLGAQWRF